MPLCECGRVFSDQKDVGDWNIDAHRTTCMHARLHAANLQKSEMSDLLRSWMQVADLAQDITFVPIRKTTQKYLEANQ